MINTNHTDIKFTNHTDIKLVLNLIEAVPEGAL